MSEHLDLDGLADVLAGERPADHVRDCPQCRAALTDLEAAMPQVAVALSALPLPPVPDDLEARLDAALAAERGTVTQLRPRQSSPQRGWQPLATAGAAVAAAGAIVFGGTLLERDDRSGGTTATTVVAAPMRSVTGLDYDREGMLLKTQLPALLNGVAAEAAPLAGGDVADNRAGAPSAPGGTGTVQEQKAERSAANSQALARLRTEAGLASCLAALTPPDQVLLPIALDYASFEGEPALVVVLPTGKPDKVDVFVVGARCGQADEKLLYYVRLNKPG